MTRDPKWGEPGPTHNPDILAGFRARPTDVLISTAPKAGTTWMQQILHQLRSGGDADFDSIDRVVPWLELPRPGRTVAEILARYESMDEPRIFKTHCTCEQTPGADTARIIVVSRDPRDCCVSFYHHVMDMTDGLRARVGLEQYVDFDSLFAGWMRQASWYRNIQGWWPHFNDDNLLWLRYEDLRTDLAAGIDRIIGFLGWNVTPGQRRMVLEYSSFEWMKRHTEKFTRQLSSDRPDFKPGGFIRKGMSGDYGSMLSDTQARAIIDEAHRRLPPDCLEFLGI